MAGSGTNISTRYLGEIIWRLWQTMQTTSHQMCAKRFPCPAVPYDEAIWPSIFASYHAPSGHCGRGEVCSKMRWTNAWKLPSKTAPTRPNARKKVRGNKKKKQSVLWMSCGNSQFWTLVAIIRCGNCKPYWRNIPKIWRRNTTKQTTAPTAGQPYSIVQAKGGEQGDPLMPALFSLGQGAALQTVQAELEAGDDLCVPGRHLLPRPARTGQARV